LDFEILHICTYTELTKSISTYGLDECVLY